MTVHVIIDASAWRSAVQRFGAFDYCHTYDFHALSAANGEGEPIAYLVTDADGRDALFWPALRRRVGATEFHDLTSVYGYGGPLVGEGTHRQASFAQLAAAWAEDGIVSVFSRLHPLFVGALDDLVHATYVGDVAVLDARSAGGNMQTYRGSHRREIERAEKSGVTVRVSRNENDVRVFYDIYCATMKALNASDYYYFSLKYFLDLINVTDFDSYCLLSCLDERPISAALFIKTHNILQYYMSGTLFDMRRLAPSKLIIAKAHGLAASWGVTDVVLGGGVGARDDDLLKFKLGFGGARRPFHVWKQVVLPDVYEQLCRGGGFDPSSGFFPLYRSSV